MAVDVIAYAKELMDAGEVKDAEQRKALEAFFSNDKVKAKFEPTLREATEGIERERGRTRAESEKAAKAEADKNAYYQEQLKTYNANKAAVEAAQAEVARYIATYGELPGGANPANPAARAAAVQDVIDKKALEERVLQTENNTLGLVTTALKLSDQHRRDFPNDPFPVDDIIKTATEKKLTAAQAYADVMGPKVEAARIARAEADKKAAVDAALVEERSKRGAAAIVDSQPRSEFMNNLVKSNDQPLTARESFLKGWRDPAASATMKQEFGREH